MASRDLPLAVGPSNANALASSGDVEDGTADVGGLVRGEPQDGARDLLGLAKEVAGDGIRVNGIRPGLVDTEIHAIRPPGQLEKMVKMVPMGRMASPEEAARTILWLASPEASYVTAAIVDASGGF